MGRKKSTVAGLLEDVLQEGADRLSVVVWLWIVGWEEDPIIVDVFVDLEEGTIYTPIYDESSTAVSSDHR